MFWYCEWRHYKQIVCMFFNFMQTKQIQKQWETAEF